jgi:hypothetical protein
VSTSFILGKVSGQKDGRAPGWLRISGRPPCCRADDTRKKAVPSQGLQPLRRTLPESERSALSARIKVLNLIPVPTVEPHPPPHSRFFSLWTESVFFSFFSKLGIRLHLSLIDLARSTRYQSATFAYCVDSPLRPPASPARYLISWSGAAHLSSQTRPCLWPLPPNPLFFPKMRAESVAS